MMHRARAARESRLAMARHVVAVLAAYGLAACSSTPRAPDAPRDAGDLALAPYASQQECRHLARGDRLDYRFTSTAPVAFGIRYRDANAVVMPITRESVTADSGIFQPIDAHEYCLTWEAGAAAAKVDFRVIVRRRTP